MPEDNLTLTLRLHDPKEKQDAAKSTSWVVVQVPREDLKMDDTAFIDKHFLPALKKLEREKLNQA